ncbi:hypothetical protein TNCV_2895221 [Trichonephila clavipes]|nr:hypothetical protein TNCV_2895221 [Trichonephila clavipes]
MRALGDEPRNFKPRSSDEDSIIIGTFSPNYHITQTGGYLSLDGFSVHSAPLQDGSSTTLGFKFKTGQPRIHDHNHYTTAAVKMVVRRKP